MPENNEFREEELKSVSGGVSEKRKKYRIDMKKCIFCLICEKACSSRAIQKRDERYLFIHPASCVGCGVCAEKCPRQAITE